MEHLPLCSLPGLHEDQIGWSDKVEATEIHTWHPVLVVQYCCRQLSVHQMAIHASTTTKPATS